MAVTGSPVCLVVAFVVSIVMNGLAGAGVFGKGIGEISNENPTFVTPDSTTFAVWGLIYTLLTILVSAQICCHSDNTEAVMSQRVLNLDVRQRLVIAFLLNAAWLPVYIQEMFWIALVIIVLYLLALISVYVNMNTRKMSTFGEWLAFAAPIATNASWVTVATCANIFTCLRVAGVKDEFGVGGSVPAAMIVCVLVAGVALFLVVVNRSIMWSFVSAWALLGIYRAQSTPDFESFPVQAMNSTLANTAIACAVVTLGATFVILQIIVCEKTGFKQDAGYSLAE